MTDYEILQARVQNNEQSLTHHVDVRAPYREKPCALYKRHTPIPTLTEGHHVHPVFLQNRLYGQIKDNELKYLCSNCHDSVHEWLYWLLGQRRSEPRVGRIAKAEAQWTFEWFTTEWARLHPGVNWETVF